MSTNVVEPQTVEALQREIEKLSDKALWQLHDWLADYAADRWDEQIARDVKAGKLDKRGAEALAAHARGETTEL